MNKYCYIERNNIGVIQKYTKPSWFRKTFFNDGYEWRDFCLCTDKEWTKDFYERSYKDIKI